MRQEERKELEKGEGKKKRKEKRRLGIKDRHEVEKRRKEMERKKREENLQTQADPLLILPPHSIHHHGSPLSPWRPFVHTYNSPLPQSPFPI